MGIENFEKRTGDFERQEKKLKLNPETFGKLTGAIKPMNLAEVAEQDFNISPNKPNQKEIRANVLASSLFSGKERIEPPLGAKEKRLMGVNIDALNEKQLEQLSSHLC